MDGVLVKGETLIEGAAEFITRLYKSKKPFLLFTNNSKYSSESHSTRLAGLNLHIQAKNIFTAGMATAQFLKNQCVAFEQLLGSLLGVRESLGSLLGRSWAVLGLSWAAVGSLCWDCPLVALIGRPVRLLESTSGGLLKPLGPFLAPPAAQTFPILFSSGGKQKSNRGCG